METTKQIFAPSLFLLHRACKVIVIHHCQSSSGLANKVAEHKNSQSYERQNELSSIKSSISYYKTGSSGPPSNYLDQIGRLCYLLTNSCCQ